MCKWLAYTFYILGVSSSFKSVPDVASTTSFSFPRKRESSLKSKFTTNQPMRTDSCKEHENNKTNNMSHILTLEKLNGHLIKSKLMVGQENGISSSNGGPIRRSPNRASVRYQSFWKDIDQNNQGSSYRHVNFSLLLSINYH